jgi:hypothetical protein
MQSCRQRCSPEGVHIPGYGTLKRADAAYADVECSWHHKSHVSTGGRVGVPG